jgi:hypothetical protein
MGCGSSRPVEYEFEKTRRFIPRQQAITLERWAKGSQARRTLRKMKDAIFRKIIGKYTADPRSGD